METGEESESVVDDLMNIVQDSGATVETADHEVCNYMYMDHISIP